MCNITFFTVNNLSDFIYLILACLSGLDKNGLFFLTLDARLLARSQYSEGLATGHLDTGFSWFSLV